MNDKTVLQKLVIAFFLLLFCSSPLLASETEYIYRWNEGDTGDNAPPPDGIDTDTGDFKKVEFRYDTDNDLLSVEVQIAPPANFPERLASSFALILSDGPYPHHAGGEYPVFYFDGSEATLLDRGSPVLTTYTYEPNDLEWDSGSWLTGDEICTSILPVSCANWVQSLTVTNNQDGSRTFHFSVTATALNNFTPTNMNPGGRGWQGPGFEDQIGFWLIPYGYPNISFTYDNNGFISSLSPGQNPGAEFQGFFDDHSQETFREPYCTGLDESLTIPLNEEFTSTVTGKSPEGNPLTMTVSGAPDGSTITPPTGTTDPMGMISALFAWTPSEVQAGNSYTIDFLFEDENGSATCSLNLTVEEDDTPIDPDEPEDCLGVPGGDAMLDQCGVCEGDGTSCLGCTTIDLRATQLSMDNATLAQLQNVRRYTRKYVREANGTSSERRAKRYRKRTNKAAELEYKDAWEITYSFAGFMDQCTNTIFCVSISNAVGIQSYVDNVDNLFDFSKRTKDRIDRLGVETKKLIRQARRARANSLSAASDIPPSRSECTTGA